MYCQGCGAKNTDDARFCNMCGERIAAAGAPGGMLGQPTQLGVALSTRDVPPADPGAQNVPLAHAATVHEPIVAPSGGGAGSPVLRSQRSEAEALEGPTGYVPSAMSNTMSISLEAIGVRSSRRTWAAITLLSVALVTLGAIGMHFAESNDELEADSGHAQEDDPFVIGTPVPEGELAPGVDFVSGTEGSPGSTVSEGRSPQEGSEAGSSTSGRGASGSRGSTRAGSHTGTSGSGSSSSGGGSTGAGSGSSGGGGSASGGGSTGAGSGSPGGSSGGSSSGGSASGDSPSGGSGSGDGAGSGGSGSSEDGASGEGGDTGSSDPGTDAPEANDLEMDLYAGRVRYLIRRYYAGRAQTCFDMATRNNPSLSGTVVIGMTIGTSGTVTRATVARNTTGESGLATCLQNQVRSWELAPPPGGQTVTMNMPFSR